MSLSKRKKLEREKKRKEIRKKQRAADAERRAYQRKIDEWRTGYSDPELIRGAQRTNVHRPFSGGGPGLGKRS